MKAILARKPRPPIKFSSYPYNGYTVGQEFVMRVLALNEQIRLKSLAKSSDSAEFKSWAPKRYPPKDFNQWGAKALPLHPDVQAHRDHVRDTQRANEEGGRIPKRVYLSFEDWKKARRPHD